MLLLPVSLHISQVPSFSAMQSAAPNQSGNACVGRNGRRVLHLTLVVIIVCQLCTGSSQCACAGCSSYKDATGCAQCCSGYVFKKRAHDDDSTSSQYSASSPSVEGDTTDADMRDLSDATQDMDNTVNGGLLARLMAAVDEDTQQSTTSSRCMCEQVELNCWQFPASTISCDICCWQ